MSKGGRVLLIVSGGIAACKVPDLIRRLREREIAVRCVLTEAGAQFVTPLSLAALSGATVKQALFSLSDEAEMGHIELSRSADLIVIAPASADLLAKMAAGLADDLASTLLLATDTPVLAVPTMNVRMWDHAATRANVDCLRQRGIRFVDPVVGPMACGEFGPGRMAELADIVEAIQAMLVQIPGVTPGPLSGRTALVTSGPTHEAIDPVRYIANRSSGRQGHGIATALAGLGATVRLVTGPTSLPDPMGVDTTHIASARDMLSACLDALPTDIAVCAAAVADWRVRERADGKISKDAGSPPRLEFVENPDILQTICDAPAGRPALVVGFAAETADVVPRAQAKRQRKGCDWIVANDVADGTGTIGGDENRVSLITGAEVEAWPRLPKDEVAARLAARIAAHFESA